MADHNIPPPLQPRPYDRTIAAGPPASPPRFPDPDIKRGRREDVLCFDEQRQEHFQARNCLFRDYSRDVGPDSSEAALGRVQQAYWPIEEKQPVNTIMGHVEFCRVLTRTQKRSNVNGNGNSIDDDNDNNDDENTDLLYDSDDSISGDSDCDEDIVFTLTTRIVAVKVNYGRRVEHHRGRHAEDPVKELSAMQLIGNDHPHVMGVIEALFTAKNLNVVMPFADSGDLFDMLQDAERTNQRFSENKAKKIFKQLVAGVIHIHSRGLCHRDLSPENVMIDQNNCLVIDMGMAIRIPYANWNSQQQKPTTIQNGGTEKLLIRPQGTAGKSPYMSPEIYQNRKAFDGEAVDVWTMGAILFCMVTGNRSYSRPESTDVQFYWMTRAMPRLLADWQIDLSYECVELLTNLLRIDPRLRYTLEEIWDHPWLTQANPDEVH